MESRSVSRVLFQKNISLSISANNCRSIIFSNCPLEAIIYLAPALPLGSSGLPERNSGPLFDLASASVNLSYLTLLRMGFTKLLPHSRTGELLPHRFSSPPTNPHSRKDSLKISLPLGSANPKFGLSRFEGFSFLRHFP